MADLIEQHVHSQVAHKVRVLIVFAVVIVPSGVNMGCGGKSVEHFEACRLDHLAGRSVGDRHVVSLHVVAPL